MGYPTISGIEAVEKATNPDFTLLGFAWFAHVGLEVAIDDKSDASHVIVAVSSKVQALRDCAGYFLVQTAENASHSTYLRPVKKDLAGKRLLFERSDWERKVAVLNGNVLPKLHYEREWFALPKGLLPERFADKISAVQLDIDAEQGSVEDALTFEESRRVFPLQVKVANMNTAKLEAKSRVVQADFKKAVAQAEKAYGKATKKAEELKDDDAKNAAIAEAEETKEAAIDKAEQIRSITTDSILVEAMMDLLGEADYNLWKKAQKAGNSTVLTKHLNRLVEAHFQMPEGMLRSLPEKTAKALYAGVVEQEERVTRLPEYQSLQPQQEEEEADPKAQAIRAQGFDAA